MIETDAGNRPVEVDDLDADTLLALLGDAEKQDRAAGRRKLRYAAHWCALHPGTPEDHAVVGDGYGPRDPSSDCDLAIGGEGTPLVASGTAEEFGAALGVATVTGLNWLADALDLKFRLKQTWARVEALEVPTWKARRLAQLTHPLPKVAAAWVDNELAPRLDQLGLPTIERTVLKAIAAFCPELLPEQEKAGKDAWGVHLDRTAHVNSGVWAGTSSIEAYGDTRDLIEFHALVCAIAEELRKAGDTDTLDQRKAKALGIIARGEQGQYAAAAGDGEDAAADPSAPAGATTKPDRRRRGAPTKLYLHINSGDLAEHAVRGATRTGPTRWGSVERLGQASLDRLADWLGHDQFTVTPVLDLNRTDAVDRHDPPLWMRELVILRDKHCIFPWCATDARSCDLDHIVRYRQGPDPNDADADADRAPPGHRPARPTPTTSPPCAEATTTSRPTAAGNTDATATAPTPGPAPADRPTWSPSKARSTSTDNPTPQRQQARSPA
jgi:hypothetical protein